MNPRCCLLVGALYGALAVTTGAFGAHGLEDRLTAEGMNWWHTAVQYQFWSLSGLLVLGLLTETRLTRGAGWCFTLGIGIFSGTLYAMALGGPRWLGAVTPVGGLLLIAGWLCLAWAGYQRKAQEERKNSANA